MQKENEKTTETAVMTAMAKFLSEIWFEEEIREQPEHMCEIFEAILVTQVGDYMDLRIKMINCIRTINKLAEALEPFSDLEIKKAYQKMLNT
ncbi:hypothetical protein L1276_001400 [Flavobacterium sp. HSC-32F16]|uniref:hypothetical protein n=1 Tax=Flavobacterium sp. HSC-32F16 TaxID=2910964 RepID=UPI0020A54869|nr:hypothetical protein [Flavobacterium sp. HSC-32F16]MCP2026256.1 hypothetical protein [Flavobacterium sp. HSC-32F16]